MTAAPLPAPRPDRPRPCPFCGAELIFEHGWWGHDRDSDCYLAFDAIKRNTDLARWNRRAPEAQAWRERMQERDL